MDELLSRVEKFLAVKLPGQPRMMHVETANLVQDLWEEIERFRKQNNECTWELNRSIPITGSEFWQTSCGNDHQFFSGTPEENDYEYCPYCGCKLKAIELESDI